MDLKFLVDILASLSSAIAIGTVMVGWYLSTRKPLKVTRLVIHKQKGTATYIPIVRNVKAYPVTIKRTDCYKRKKYEVQKRHGGRPEYSELFPSSELVFTTKKRFNIAAKGHTDIRIENVALSDVPNKLLFLLETSHGFHELWCKDIVIVEVGKADVYSLIYGYDFKSKWLAKIVYYWKKLVS